MPAGVAEVLRDGIGEKGIGLDESLLADQRHAEVRRCVREPGSHLEGLTEGRLRLRFARGPGIVVGAPVDPGTIENTATVEAYTVDPDPGDNSSPPVSTVVTGLADLSLSITDTPDPVTTAETLVYSIEVTNTGPTTKVRMTAMKALGTMNQLKKNPASKKLANAWLTTSGSS